MEKVFLRSRKLFVIAVTVLFSVAMLLSLTGCPGGEKLSGTYVNKDDSQDYMKFTGSELIMYEMGMSLAGSYSISGDKIVLKGMFLGMELAEEYTLSEDRNSFSNGIDTYVKEGTVLGTTQDSTTDNITENTTPEPEIIYPVLNLPLKIYNSTLTDADRYGNGTYISNDGKLTYTESSYASSKPHSTSDGVRSVFTDFNNMFFIKDDNTLWGRGYNSSGSLGDNTGVEQIEPKKILDDVANIYPFCGTASSTTYAVKNDRTLWGWGGSDGVNLLTGNTDNVYAPIKLLDNVVKFYCFGSNNFVIQTDGSLLAWGNNLGSSEKYSTPVKIFGGVTDIFNIDDYTIAIINSDNKLFVFGKNNSDMEKYLAIENNGFIETPVAVFPDKNIRYFNYYSSQYYFIDTDDTLWAVGAGGLGDGTMIERTSPVEIFKNVRYIAYLGSATTGNCLLTNSGELYLWGNDRYTPEKSIENVAAVIPRYAPVIGKDGTVYRNGLSVIGEDIFCVVSEFTAKLPNYYYMND